ncbi:S8 family serine peptidase [Calditrichota bacterium GD2]
MQLKKKLLRGSENSQKSGAASSMVCQTGNINRDYRSDIGAVVKIDFFQSFKIFFLIFIFAGITAAFSQDVFQNQLLVALKRTAQPLPTGKVRFQASLDRPKLSRILQKYRVTRIERWLKSADQNDVYEGIDFTKVYRFYFEKSSSPKLAIKELQALPEVEQVSFEPIVKIAVPIAPVTTSDPYLERQYYLEKIMARYVWRLMDQVEQPEGEILIGIVDTGIDYLHPEMEPVLYINPGEDIDGDGRMTEADLNGLDDDGNGFVDDVRGWDFSYASDSSSGDNDIRPPNSGGYDILSHGTHVAGIAGAMADNGVGISGIARGYKIIGTKHSRDDDLSHGYLYNAYDGILYCAKLGADVINCSWGGQGYYEVAQKLIDMVRQDYGAIVVAAAGNDNNNNDNNHFYPSDLDGVVTVAALGPDDRKASFSNYGHVIDISAPGVGIFSTIHYYKGGYATWQGTSMASPVVAGSIALVKYFFPQLSPDQLVEKVLQAADPLDALNQPYAGLLGSGKVNVYNAIGPHFLPNVAVLQDTLQWDDLNGNGQIDPGESINIRLKLVNKEGWRPAFDVRIVAFAEDSLLHITDSVAVIGDMPQGSEQWSAPGDITIVPDAAHPYGPVKISFIIEGVNEAGEPLREFYEKQLLLSMYQEHFPRSFKMNNAPISVVKASADSSVKLAFINDENQLILLNDAGQVVAPFPIDLGEYHRVPPVVADLDGDGQQEIAVLSNYGKLKVFKTDGALLLDRDLNEVVYGSFAADDLDGDGQPEIIIATMRKKLHVLALSGEELPGFPVALSSIAPEGVAIGDVNEDGRKEIVVSAFDNTLHLFDRNGAELAGWPVELPGNVKFTPIIAKDRNGAFIGVITKSNQLLLLKPDGSFKLSVNLRADVKMDPFLVDLNRDGLLEFCFVDAENQLIGYDSQNKRYLFRLGAEINSPPLVFYAGDQLRLVSVNIKGTVTIFDEAFKPTFYSPVQLPYTLNNFVSLADLDGDGDREVVVSGEGRIAALDLPEANSNTLSWSAFLGNEQRTAFFEIDSASATAIVNKGIVPDKLALKVFPNPFNASVKINIAGSGLTRREKISLKIFDIRGRLVKTLADNRPAADHLNFFWNGRNEKGQYVSSGVYLLQADVTDHGQIIKRLIYIK